MTDLSPAALAVRLAAIYAGPELEGRIAAALRAVADQSENFYVPHIGDVSVVCVEKLLAIADELEAHQ